MVLINKTTKLGVYWVLNVMNCINLGCELYNLAFEMI
jgi:hypothetical protein